MVLKYVNMIFEYSTYLKGSDSVFIEQCLILFGEEWYDGLLVSGGDHVTERHVLEAFVLTDFVI